MVSVEYSNETGKNKHDTPMTDSTKTELTSVMPHKPEEPFLPSHDMKYTLVMDLDETLVHYEDNGVTGQFYLRPYAQEFINEMSKYYEIVIFTAALQDYADWIINRLDTKNRISHRLYRHHTSNSANNYHIKVFMLLTEGPLQTRPMPIEDHHCGQHTGELPIAS